MKQRITASGRLHLEGPILKYQLSLLDVQGGNLKMEEKDIERLFLSVADSSKNQTSEVKDVFSVLVSSTLQYRDDMLASEGIIITVEDVRVTLQHLIPFLETDRLPGAADHVKTDLLKIWRDNLRQFENPDK